jgi:hypothetical protein
MVMGKSALSTLFGSTNNPVPSSNVYPSDAGNPLAIAASAGSTASVGTSGMGGMNATASAGNNVGGSGIAGWVAILVVYLVLSFVAKKAGQAEEFKNIRLSAYNVLTITLAAIIGITLLKVAFTKFQVKGITPLLQAV